MSTDYQKTTAKAIPATRRVTVSDAAHMPLDYSVTPGGTLFSTTPGGKKWLSVSLPPCNDAEEEDCLCGCFWWLTPLFTAALACSAQANAMRSLAVRRSCAEPVAI